MNMAKDTGAWTLNQVAPDFDAASLGMIDINDLNPQKVEKKPVPKKVDNNEAMNRWMAAQQKRGNAKRVLMLVLVLFSLIVLMVSAMVATAEAGQAFMRFKIHTVTEETIIVMDEHEDFFTFYKEGSPDVKVGDEVIVCTDLTFTDGKWEWNRSRTAIIDVVR